MELFVKATEFCGSEPANAKSMGENPRTHGAFAKSVQALEPPIQTLTGQVPTTYRHRPGLSRGTGTGHGTFT